MGRAFEYRKARKLKRWGNMSRTFTKIGKEITIAVKAAGPDPEANSRLRVLIQNSKAANMPKETVERAIKKATSKDEGNYKEVLYEGYGPYGIAIVVETATDNTTRTVANVRSYFNKAGGSLGTSGSLDFLFDHKSVFKVTEKEGLSLDELELELIDFGVDEVDSDEGEVI
ncbi:MAG: YebC/PmpR family DNA-binding transcriptional regulator, partial [Bacteroidales bacterium]